MAAESRARAMSHTSARPPPPGWPSALCSCLTEHLNDLNCAPCQHGRGEASQSTPVNAVRCFAGALVSCEHFAKLGGYSDHRKGALSPCRHLAARWVTLALKGPAYFCLYAVEIDSIIGWVRAVSCKSCVMLIVAVKLPF